MFTGCIFINSSETARQNFIECKCHWEAMTKSRLNCWKSYFPYPMGECGIYINITSVQIVKIKHYS